MTRAAASILLALLLGLGLAGCGDDTDDSGAAGKKESSSSTTQPDVDDASDTDETPATPPVLTDGPGDATLTFSGGEGKLGSGEWDQSSVEIEVGQVVEFQAGDGGTYAVGVGGLDAVTMVGGLKEYYRFDAPGTYPVEEDLSGATSSVVVR